MVMAQKMNYNLLTFWISIEFSDYGSTIISKLSLHSLHGWFIWNLSLRLSRSSLR